MSIDPPAVQAHIDRSAESDDVFNAPDPKYSPTDDGFAVDDGGDDLDTMSEGFDRIEQTGGF